MLPEPPPSKTRIKQAMLELQALGERLVALSARQLDALSLPQHLHEAVREAQRITQREARRRQLQYIGRLMRDVDPEPIRERLKIWEGRSAERIAIERRVAHWRERLIEDDAALAELVRTHPGFDIQRLRALVRNARLERNSQRPPHGSRELFRMLRDILSA